ncbi:unnamed protein product [Rhizophagus irregularis]|uniref:Protein kinase domain-containing protein n=1 Tax=Rhizophagus irregularis TaxID=588596 RepID=A0A916E754_9GLOM|nr:unnamed protein product [Rhizophagus irregularis]
MRYNNETVILKKFINSQGISKYFLNELESNTLWKISEGLEIIHHADYTHRDFHSGNILCKNIEQFDQAEIKRAELIGSKKLGPEFSEVPHPKAIYTSRSLSPYISECSSISSIYSSKDYISRELEFDID